MSNVQDLPVSFVNNPPDLPKLQPTNIVSGREARVHKLPPSADRWKLRSVTYQGIAEAMAQQWGWAS